MKYLTAIFLLLMSSVVFAKPHVLLWDWPVQDCEGSLIIESNLLEAEIAYDVNPMPMPSDTDGECAPTIDPSAPQSATVALIPVTANFYELNLKPGETYYARIRVSTFLSGNWSSWSAEKEFTVPFGRPKRATWLN